MYILKDSTDVWQVYPSQAAHRVNMAHQSL